MADQHRRSSSSSSSSPSLPSNQRGDDSPFTTGAHKIYHRKDSYAVPPARLVESRASPASTPRTTTSRRSSSDSSSSPPSPSSPAQSLNVTHSIVPPRRPAGVRARAASYAGPSTSGSSRNDFFTGNISNESNTSGNNKQYGPPHLPSSLSSISRAFAISTTAATHNSSITLSTLSDPSRTVYPQSPTKQRLAAKRRRKQLSEAGLGRTLFEKVEFSDEKMNWSTHALPSSSVHHVGESTMTDSEREVLAAEVRARLGEQSLSEVTRRKEVRWGTVHIREYKMILGDNPSCIGAPLGLGWEWWVPSITCGRHVGDGRHDENLACRNNSSSLHQAGSSSHTNASTSTRSDSGNSASNDANVRTVDQYEKRRGLRLRGNQLKLSPLAREAILKRMGTPQSEIEAASRANYVVQIERNATLAALANTSGNGNGSQWFDAVMKFLRHNGNGNGSGGEDVSRFPGESMLRRTWSEPALVPYSRNHCTNSSDASTCSSGSRGILKHDTKLGVKST